jgi:hypothetical protein
MKKITDDDLTLLYYGEQSDPTLAATVAASAELSARYDTLCTELLAANLAKARFGPDKTRLTLEGFAVRTWSAAFQLGRGIFACSGSLAGLHAGAAGKPAQ